MSKLSNIVTNDVVKKTICKKVINYLLDANVVRICGLASKIQNDLNKNGLKKRSNMLTKKYQTIEC